MISLMQPSRASPERSVTSATLYELLPRPTHRALFVGQTGAGKTTLAERLLRLRPFVVVHDGKGTIRWSGYKLVRKVRQAVELPPATTPRIIYRPDPDEALDQAAQERFWAWILERGSTTVYVDEIYALAHRGVYPHGYHAAITRGRERGVEVWSSTQRPAWVPLAVLSEAEHVYVFRLQLPADRQRIEATTGLQERAMMSLRKHLFWYVEVGEEPVGPIRLRL